MRGLLPFMLLLTLAVALCIAGYRQGDGLGLLAVLGGVVVFGLAINMSAPRIPSIRAMRDTRMASAKGSIPPPTRSGPEASFGQMFGPGDLGGSGPPTS